MKIWSHMSGTCTLNTPTQCHHLPRSTQIETPPGSPTPSVHLPTCPTSLRLFNRNKRPIGFDVAREVCKVLCSPISITYFISAAAQKAPVLIELSSDEDDEKVESAEVDRTLADPEHWGSDDVGSWILEGGASPDPQLPIDALQDDVPKDAPSSPPVHRIDESIGDVWTLERKYTL